MISNRQKILVPILVFLFLGTSLLATFLAQTPTPSPSPTPGASPSPSPTTTPVPRAPTPTPLPGAQNFHQWGSVTVFNGLPSDTVRAIAQTPDGVMWFGTDNGLARFDGRRVQKFSPGGPATDQILVLKIAPTGDLWIGTRDRAFVHASGRFQEVANTNGTGVTAILMASAKVYLGTDTGLVLNVEYDANGTPVASPMFDEPIQTSEGVAVKVTGLLELGNGELLATTSGRDRFVVRQGSREALPASNNPPFINSVVRDGDGTIWLGSDALRGASGIFSSPRERPQMRIAAPTATVFAVETNESGVWAGTERFGLFHIVNSKLKKNYTFENTSGGLRSNTVYALFTDREGVVWIGTNRGVSRFDRLGASQETVSDIPNSNFIRSLFRADDGKLYAGSNRGLFIKNDEKWSEVATYGNRSIFALTEDAGGRLLVGSVGNRTSTQGTSADTRSFANFRGGIFAAVTGHGLVQFRPASSDLIHADPSINSLCAAGDKLWIGTIDKGLFSFDGRSVKPEIEHAVLKAGTIWKISAAPDGAIWIAGQHGVFRVREGVAERIVEVEDVRDVFIDGDHIWAATTTRGLIHIRRDERYGWLVSAFGFEQGLPSEKAFSIIRADDGILIGTNRGVVTYKAGSIAPKLIPVRILSQRVHDLSEIASTIQLDYPQNSLLVEVAGQSSRTFPEEFQYIFHLRNSKGDLIDSRISNEPQLAPSDLSPGEYSIDAVALDRDLNLSEPLTIRFSIAKAPFPWTATALGVLLLLSLLGLAWAIIEHRRIAERNRELAAARLDLANEAERERRRIARDLHDQTLADLRQLMITSDKLEGDNREFRSEIEAVSTEIRRICEDLSPSVLENVGLVAALEFLLDRTVGNRKFNADPGVEDRIGFPLNVQLQIYRIAQEVLTNIDRHSDANLVEMDVAASETGDFVLKIRDNGSVFQPDGSVKGRGISNIRARANLIHGKVAWKESKQGGNVFSLRIDGPA